MISISGIIGTLLMFITLRKKIGPFGLKEITTSFAKIASASIVMGLIAYGSFIFLCQFVSQNMALLAAIAVGALTYGIVILYMRIPEVDRTVESVKRRMRNRLGSKTEPKN